MNLYFILVKSVRSLNNAIYYQDISGVYLLLYTIEIDQECICCYILSRYIRSVFAAIYYQDISGVDNVILHQDRSGV